MAVQKVTYGGTTLIDLTADTATAADVLQSKTFHKADGTIATGSIAKLAAQTFTPTTADQTIAAGKYLDGAQTIKGDANLVASNIASGVSIFGVVGTFAGGGGGSEFANLVMRTITSATLPSDVTIVEKYAFYSCASLSKIAGLSVSQIKDYAFCGCKLKTIISFPLCSYIGANAFALCTSLVSAQFPSLTFIGTSAFSGCWNMEQISVPEVSSVYSNAFNACSKLATISLPKATLIQTSAFNGCNHMSIVYLDIYSGTIYSYTFQKCTRLLSLYLMGSSVVKLSAVNAFSSTPISNYTTQTGGVYGSIFVPASLYSAYISSTNWVTYSARFVSV